MAKKSNDHANAIGELEPLVITEYGFAAATEFLRDLLATVSEEIDIQVVEKSKNRFSIGYSMAQMADVRDSCNVTYDTNHDVMLDNDDFEPVSYAGDKMMPQSHAKVRVVPISPLRKGSDVLLSLNSKGRTFRFDSKRSDRGS